MTQQSSATDAENRNNPYHNTAASYEKKLKLPIVRSFRRAEETRLNTLFDANVRSSDTVLEIGCGTGYYTRDIVKRAARVIALDDSDGMLNIVRGRLSPEDLERVEFVRSEGTQFRPSEPVDVVMHIGVLDYVKEWEAFLSHSIENARRCVIFTCPTDGLWGQVFHLLSLWERVNIQRYGQRQIDEFIRERYPECRLEMSVVGLNSGWTGGLTRIGVIHTDRV